MKVIEFALLIWLLILAVVDIRKGSFSGRNLVLSAVFFGLAMAAVCFQDLKDWKMVLGGGAAGAVFLLASIVTQGAIGIGDGYILTVCGMVLGVYLIVLLIILALCFASVFGMFLWIIKKAGRHTKIPFIPFVCAGYGVIFICSIL